MVNSEPLSFEEFRRRISSIIFGEQTVGAPKYNNFFLYFVDIKEFPYDDGHNKRNTPHFQRFQQEHPELERQLTEALTEPFIARSKGRPDATKIAFAVLEKNEPQLYEAYLAMRQYIESDNSIEYELFR